MVKLIMKWVAVSLFACQPLAYAVTDTQINTLARTYMQQNGIPGMSIAVIDQGKIEIFNYGYADENKKIPTSDQTIYAIASFTKTFTATLSAVASVEEKLNLNAPFNQYIPALREDAHLATITPGMLLGHVSSLPFNFTPRPGTYQQGLTDFQQFVPPYPPGTEFNYSNAGIGIMGYVLQEIYAESYTQLLTDKVLQPLGMTSTYLHVPQDKQQYVALGHDEAGLVAYNDAIDTWFAAAALKSTIVDMAKYLNAQIDTAAVNDKTLAQAITLVHQNRYCFANKKACEQFAWQAHVMSELKTDNDDTFYHMDSKGNLSFGRQKIINNPAFPQQYFVDKTGNGFGMSSYMAYIPDQKTGVVILLNQSTVIDKAKGNLRIKLGREILQALMQSR